MNHIAILLAAHQLTKYIIEQYYRLYEATKETGDLYMLIEDGDLMKIPENIRYYSFSVNSLNALGYTPIEETIVPGSNHFQVLQFFKEHPDYDFYWNIEYDVYFNGNWQNLFIAYKNVETDFISSHIKLYSEQPYWCWWSSLQLKTLLIGQENYVRSFNPIYRLSNKALKEIDKELKLENAGHHEVLIPTILYNANFSIEDWGESNHFSTANRKRCFYSPGKDDSDINCSMRYHTPFNRMCIEKKGPDDLLYHPVKW